MRVKITGARLKTYWYYERIGDILTVEESSDVFPESYRVLGTADHIHRDDCEIVQEVAKKPPLGLRPEFIVLEHRQKEIQEAVVHYMEAGLAIPSAWTSEYYRNNSRLLEIE
jgi:hypothetical protein